MSLILLLHRCSKFDSRLAAQDSLRMRAKAHIRRQSQLSKSPFLRLGGKAVATATKIELYTPRIWRQAPNRINFQHSKPMTRNLFSRSPLGPQADASIGKGALSSAREKKQGGFKKKSGVSFFTLFFCPSPPPGGVRHCAIAGKPLLPSCSLSSRFSFIKRSRANKRSGHGTAFRKVKTEGGIQEALPPEPAKESMRPRRRKRPCGAKSKKRAEDCFWSLQTLFAPFSHKAQRTSTNSAPLPNRLPKNSGQLNRPLRFSASNFLQGSSMSDSYPISESINFFGRGSDPFR